jgi:hypothetical protein
VRKAWTVRLDPMGVTQVAVGSGFEIREIAVVVHVDPKISGGCEVGACGGSIFTTNTIR